MFSYIQRWAKVGYSFLYEKYNNSNIRKLFPIVTIIKLLLPTPCIFSNT